MKAGLLAVAGAIGSASALHGRHADLHKRGDAPMHPAGPEYGCCKQVVTVTVPYGGLPSVAAMSKPPYPSPSTSPAKPVIPLPTPEVTTCPTPGVYTIPEKTVVVTDTTTVCAATTVPLSKGVNTYGGVTTVVTTATTVTCPYPTVIKSANVTTTVVTSTTYVCPSAGTYTPIPPTTTDVSKSTVLVSPVPVTYTPGTYTRPAHTITVTETDYTYVCPLTISVSPSPPAPTTPAKPSPPAPAPEKPSPPAPAPEKPSQPAAPSAPSKPSAPEKPSQPAAPSAPSKPSAPASSPPAYSAPSKPSGGSTGISTNGKKWAMSYTPYGGTAGSCKSGEEVKKDLSIIAGKGFTTIRLYATDCNGLETVGAAAKELGLKMIIGIFIKGDGIAGARPQIQDIVNWGKGGNFGLVSMIVIGNEAIFNGFCTVEALASFISEAKSAFSGAGYSGPCTTTEPLNILQKSGSGLCSVIDVVAGNVQPFFNSGIEASNAGTFVAGQLELIGKVCPGKDAYNLECGWPSAGSSNGAAVPGSSQQKAAIQDIIDKVGEKTVIFSFNNDDWKHPGEFGVEQNFGCSQLF